MKKKAKFSLHRRDDGVLPEVISIIPLKDDVVFPHLIRPLSLSGAETVKALNEAISRNDLIGIVALKYDVESPKPTDFYDVGTAAKIFQVFASTSANKKFL